MKINQRERMRFTVGTKDMSRKVVCACACTLKGAGKKIDKKC